MKPLQGSNRVSPSVNQSLGVDPADRTVTTMAERELVFGLPIRGLFNSFFGPLSPEHWVNQIYVDRVSNPKPPPSSRADLAHQFLLAKWELADRPMRKMRPFEPIFIHSERVALRVKTLMQMITHDFHTIDVAVAKALLHDVPEDMSKKFGPAVQEITEKFGDSIGYSVHLMSTPELHRLVRKYAGLVQDMLPALQDGTLDLTSADPIIKDKVKTALKDILAKMKDERPEDYVMMKSRVTLQYKRDSANVFPLDTAINKDVDAADSVRCHVLDIKAGREKIVMGTSQVSPKPYDGVSPSEITYDRLVRMVEERRDMHKIYMAKIREQQSAIAASYAKESRPLWHAWREPRQYKLSGFSEMNLALESDFYQSINDLESLMKTAKQSFMLANDNKSASSSSSQNDAYRPTGSNAHLGIPISKPAPGSAAA